MLRWDTTLSDPIIHRVYYGLNNEKIKISNFTILPPDLLRSSGEESEEDERLLLLEDFSGLFSLLEGRRSSDLSRPLAFSSDFSLLREPLSADLSLLEPLSFDLSLLELLSSDLSFLPPPRDLSLDLSRLLEDFCCE